MKVTLKGTVLKQSDYKETTSGKSFTLLLKVPGLANTDGDQITEPEIFELWGGEKALKELQPGAKLDGLKVEVGAYLNSRTWKATGKDGKEKDGYNLSLRINSIVLI